MSVTKFRLSHLGVGPPKGGPFRRLGINQKGLVPLWGTTLFVALVTTKQVDICESPIRPGLIVVAYRSGTVT